jgi:hypothetical protein
MMANTISTSCLATGMSIGGVCCTRFRDRASGWSSMGAQGVIVAEIFAVKNDRAVVNAAFYYGSVWNEHTPAHCSRATRSRMIHTAPCTSMTLER